VRDKEEWRKETGNERNGSRKKKKKKNKKGRGVKKEDKSGHMTLHYVAF
jgi:hypothetical protein